jgi:hypothetical protein
MTDKIADIRERHKASDNNFIEYESTWDIHADRATLLAEVERLRAKVAWLEKHSDEIEAKLEELRWP